MNPKYRYKINIPVASSLHGVTVNSINEFTLTGIDYLNWVPGTAIIQIDYAPCNVLIVDITPHLDGNGAEITTSGDPLPIGGSVYLMIGGFMQKDIHPFYKDDLCKEYDLESSQMFFRVKLSTTLKLILSEYDLLDSQNFDSVFTLIIQSYASGIWTDYYTGTFCKTDVVWSVDDRMCEITVQTLDNYTNVLAGLQVENDVIKLLAEQMPISIMKRPVIQAYILGGKVMSYFLGGTYWESPTTQVIDSETDIINIYKFSLISKLVNIIMTGTNEEGHIYDGVYTGSFDSNHWLRSDGAYYIYYVTGSNFRLMRTSDNHPMLDSFTEMTPDSIIGTPLNFQSTSTFITVSSSLGEMDIIYERYLLDVTTLSGVATFSLPTNDISGDNLNYAYCAPCPNGNAVVSAGLTTTPTEFGQNDLGSYFNPPVNIGGELYHPICRSSWINVSYWFQNNTTLDGIEVSGRQAFTIKENYKLSSVINVLLKAVAPGLTHDETCSEFFYGETNPLTGQKFYIAMTPKSNILHGVYDQPAQKAPLTLQSLFDMLMNCYKCYWYLDGNKLKIEHVSWFKNGGTYGTNQKFNIDLTQLRDPSSGQKWDYIMNTFKFNKLQLTQYYQFKWMDDTVSEAFTGFPIQLLSTYVQPGKIENINIDKFTTDIDYMMINPTVISQDGFALFSAVSDDGINYYLPFVCRNINGENLILQNGYLSWITLHPNYWIYDLPASQANINNTIFNKVDMMGIQRNKVQDIKYPANVDPDPLKLVKTLLGNGQIQKLSVNLCSRMNTITLAYDTE